MASNSNNAETDMDTNTNTNSGRSEDKISVRRNRLLTTQYAMLEAPDGSQVSMSVLADGSVRISVNGTDVASGS